MVAALANGRASSSAVRTTAERGALVATLHTVLVVAPDQELRRSIEFALEAEGFIVASYALLAAALVAPQSGKAACAVVDEEAIIGQPESGDRLQRLGRPVILLIDRLQAVPPAAVVQVLMKPMLGSQLVESVGRAIAAE